MHQKQIQPRLPPVLSPKLGLPELREHTEVVAAALPRVVLLPSSQTMHMQHGARLVEAAVLAHYGNVFSKSMKHMGNP